MEASVRVLAGHADNIGPSLTLQINFEKDGLRHHREYLFGVGSCLSRALLEHKCRPTRHLRAAFCCTLDSSSSGGLGGLILRLRADGHGKVCAALLLYWDVLSIIPLVPITGSGLPTMTITCR